ncbi:unnamed protein product [Adineta steineri]|uniref:Uncharacterized protein n=1 Tax=Adineta steineri TaxID=433720 RepID=A0A814YQA5_9BILA|nr:unnamed protein product [Adineta steineri]CAF4055339.1 unnamed protein product [Adineta steineri]
MATASSKRVAFARNESSKCTHRIPHLIYDEPYIFQVRSQRTRSLHKRPCDDCLKASKQQQQRLSTANIQYEKRCSRLPPKPIDFEQMNRPKTAPLNRRVNDCNWDNFMTRKSKFAIKTPYALCNLSTKQEELENRPSFMNYGGRSNDKQGGQKRTFNSLAIHQLKHHEVDNERLRSLLRERHLHHQAENYFREMEKRKDHK